MDRPLKIVKRYIVTACLASIIAVPVISYGQVSAGIAIYAAFLLGASFWVVNWDNMRPPSIAVNCPDDINVVPTVKNRGG